MKIRAGFVGNSSSSSYLVSKDLSYLGVRCVKLTKNQISYIRERLKKELNELHDLRSKEDLDFMMSHDDVWITEFISDWSSIFEKINDESIVRSNEKISYVEGDLLDSPRNEKDFNIICGNDHENSIWILKEDDKDRKDMSIEEICSLLNKIGSGKSFDVTSSEDEVIIKIKDDDPYSIE